VSYGCGVALVEVEEQGRADKGEVAIKGPRMRGVQRSGKLREELMAWTREYLKIHCGGLLGP
jgi:hypothetical protein